MPVNDKDRTASRVGARGLGRSSSPPEPVPAPAAVPEDPQVSAPEEPQNRKKAARESHGTSYNPRLYRQFKILAAEQDRPIYALLDEAMHDYLERHGRLPQGDRHER